MSAIKLGVENFAVIPWRDLREEHIKIKRESMNDGCFWPVIRNALLNKINGQDDLLYHLALEEPMEQRVGGF